MEPIAHLFRHESGRMVAALTRIFGIQNLALAEDVVQDAFCRALEIWKFRGVPPNPSAWLMTTAKRRAIDALRRERTARDLAPELGRLLDSEWTLAPAMEELLQPQAIKDDLLRMMFSCCHPRLSEEAQVALILHILCGFSVDEVAAAFLNGHAAVEKRISRSKKVLAGSKRLFDLGDADFAERLGAVHRALYLLFNEGYHGASPEAAVRADLCQEAMRLTDLLFAHLATATPTTHALSALMCFGAARLAGRVDAAGNLTQLFEQDRSRWDADLVARGRVHLDQSATGTAVSEYHIEAAISAVHADANRPEQTDWDAIVRLYDILMTVRPSPVVALNRAIAVAQRDGPESGLVELRSIRDADRLAAYPFLPAAIGEMELRSRRHDAARDYFREALALARNPTERRFLSLRIEECATGEAK